MNETTKTVLIIAGCTAAGLAIGGATYLALDHFGVINKGDENGNGLVADAVIPEGNLEA